ncbi:MAG: protein kinase [Alphaproteobacteria bacterium]|nr:protein kinase [Alphaproteobacteria bacterium]
MERDLPWQGVPTWDLEKLVVHKKERPAINENWPLKFKRLIKKCWHPDPQKRPSFDSIIKFLDDPDDNSVLLSCFFSFFCEFVFFAYLNLKVRKHVV